MLIGIDPGKDKCGVAILTSDGEIIFEKVIATVDLESTLKNFLAQYKLELAILGNGTTHKAVEKILRDAGLTVKIVDEKYTTEEARRLYWLKNPPRGWRKILPTSLQVPPEPVDGIVAEILIRRYLTEN